MVEKVAKGCDLSKDIVFHNSFEDSLEALFKWGEQTARKINLTGEKLQRYLQEVRQLLRMQS